MKPHAACRTQARVRAGATLLGLCVLGAACALDRLGLWLLTERRGRDDHLDLDDFDDCDFDDRDRYDRDVYDLDLGHRARGRGRSELRGVSEVPRRPWRQRLRWLPSRRERRGRACQRRERIHAPQAHRCRDEGACCLCE